MLPSPSAATQDVRDQVGLRVVDLAERLGGAGHVEVAQGDAAQPVGSAVPGERRLERPLRLAVRVDRPEGGVLGDRCRVRDSVDRRGRGEHQALDLRGTRGLEQRHPAGDVVAVVARRVGDRFADQRARGAMEDRVDPLGLEKARQRVGVGVRALVEGRAGWHRSSMAGREVVEDDDVMSRPDERIRRDRADIAGPAGHQDPHARTIRGGRRSSEEICRLWEIAPHGPADRPRHVAQPQVDPLHGLVALLGPGHDLADAVRARPRPAGDA